MARRELSGYYITLTEKTITHRVSYKDAPAFFDRVNKGQVDDLIGAVIAWTE